MRQRHSLAHLFWRTMVAAGSGAAMVSGIYPLVPHAVAMARRWQRGDGGFAAHPFAAAAEWALSVAVSAARPLGFIAYPMGATHARPVILLHGYGMSRANFLLLAHRLGAAGLGPLVGFEYWSLGEVPSASRRLGAFIDRVCAETGADQVDLVGHSMGGIIGRHYVTLGGGDGRVANLVTLGSPHGGTDASRWGLGRPTRDLAPNSELLRDLARAPFPTRTRATVVWSRCDPLVGEPALARWDGAAEVIFDDLGHLTLLASRRVAHTLTHRLGTVFEDSKS